MRERYAVLTVLSAAILSSCQPAPATPTVVRLDPGLDAIVPPGAVIEKLAGGFLWAEGPIWIADGSCLLFSDTRTNKVHRWKEGEGVSVFLGVLFSLGSSSAIANAVAGVMLTYTRPFKLGDRGKIGETVGDVANPSYLSSLF